MLKVRNVNASDVSSDFTSKLQMYKIPTVNGTALLTTMQQIDTCSHAKDCFI